LFYSCSPNNGCVVQSQFTFSYFGIVISDSECKSVAMFCKTVEAKICWELNILINYVYHQLRKSDKNETVLFPMFLMRKAYNKSIIRGLIKNKPDFCSQIFLFVQTSIPFSKEMAIYMQTVGPTSYLNLFSFWTWNGIAFIPLLCFVCNIIVYLLFMT